MPTLFNTGTGSSNNNNNVFAISDGRADLTVLGMHAHVLHQTGRYATLVTYDPQNTRSE